MAKKIKSASERASDIEKAERYPWLRLLELEFQPSEHPSPRRGRGRPPSPFPRKAVHVTLTEDELGTLDELADLLSDRLESRLHRGHVIAFLVFYLSSRLQIGDNLSLPPDVNSLTELARYLDQQK